MPSAAGYTVLAPIRHGNLTVFPVVAARSYDTRNFLRWTKACVRAR